MPKYIVTLKIVFYLIPKKNYNEKTLVVFYPGKGVKKHFLGKKTTVLSSRFACVLYIKSNPHLAQTFSHNIDLNDLFTACFHAKTTYYNDHIISSSLEQVIGDILSLATFWTSCSCLKIKQDFPLPASVWTM